jgi:hypothetical protein
MSRIKGEPGIEGKPDQGRAGPRLQGSVATALFARQDQIRLRVFAAIVDQFP